MTLLYSFISEVSTLSQVENHSIFMKLLHVYGATNASLSSIFCFSLVKLNAPFRSFPSPDTF